MEKLNFSDATLLLLEREIGLIREYDLPAMATLIQKKCDLTDYELFSLERLRHLIKIKIDKWNEQELTTHCIAPILSLTEIENQQVGIFELRWLSGVVKGIEMSGKPDSMIAKGSYEPEVPYFCLQEYKKEKDSNGDPAAQALAAMLVAQSLNNNENMPIYGCYIVGRLWFFMMLTGDSYTISDGHNMAEKEDLLTIFCTLKQLKIEIYNRMTIA